MTQQRRRIVVIGAGIAGLCTAVYAQKCGYEVTVLEQHHGAGGLATSWRRNGYTFETCLHWFYGSNPQGSMHRRWQEVFDVDKLTFIHPEVFTRLETGQGDALNLYTDMDRLEPALLARAPRDAALVKAFTSAVRHLGSFELPDISEAGWRKWLALLRTVPYLPALRKWSQQSGATFAQKLHDPLLRCLFSNGEMGQMSVLSLIMALAWSHQHDAGYAIGGSQAIIRLVLDRLEALGGILRVDAKVDAILVDQDAAVGVELADGERIAADWVISAADGHATIYDLLEGRYTDMAIDSVYREMPVFPSYLQVSMGIARDLSAQPAQTTRILANPLELDPATELQQLSFRIFNFDPTFADRGKTAITCLLPTHNSAFWQGLRQNDPGAYSANKRRVADAIVSTLEMMVPGLSQDLEVLDVSTPATVVRYTGNWKGSMEGWLLTPATGLRPLRNYLPGLHKFLMVGQWVMPGGGLPSGLITGRNAIQTVCRHDRVAFSKPTPLAR